MLLIPTSKYRVKLSPIKLHDLGSEHIKYRSHLVQWQRDTNRQGGADGRHGYGLFVAAHPLLYLTPGPLVVLPTEALLWLETPSYMLDFIFNGLNTWLFYAKQHIFLVTITLQSWANFWGWKETDKSGICWQGKDLIFSIGLPIIDEYEGEIVNISEEQFVERK